jgi:hypothetical protein
MIIEKTPSLVLGLLTLVMAVVARIIIQKNKYLKAIYDIILTLQRTLQPPFALASEKIQLNAHHLF